MWTRFYLYKNALSMAYTYNRNTGARVFKPYSVDGNSAFQAGVDFGTPVTRNKLLSLSAGPWKFVTIPIAVALIYLCCLLTAAFYSNPAGLFFVGFLYVLLFLDLIILVLAFAGNILFRKVFDFGNKEYEQNDYDKDPGLSEYYDSSRKTERTVSEKLLRHVVSITDSEGRVVETHSIEL